MHKLTIRRKGNEAYRNRRRIRRQLKLYRRLRKRRRARHQKYVKPVANLFRYYAKRIGSRRARGAHESRVVTFPPRFDIHTSANEVLSSIEQLISYGINSKTKIIEFAQSNCEIIGHGAESLLNALALELKERGVSFKGTFPLDTEQREIVLATGLPSYLTLSSPIEEPSGFLTFPLTKRRSGNISASSSSRREKESTRMIEYLNECLSRHNMVLKASTEDWLHKLIGEILGNVDDHSGRPDWWMAGYLRDTPGHLHDDCHITILNLGDTIYETMQTLPMDAQLRSVVEGLVDHHNSCGYFNEQWTPEELWTLFALQEKASRLNGDPFKVGVRGTGFSDMVQFFQKLGETVGEARPRMTLISGKTQIIFDDTYPMHFTEDGRRRITFNSQCSLRYPADSLKVRRLESFFPGTLITMDIYLDPRNLSELDDTTCVQ